MRFSAFIFGLFCFNSVFAAPSFETKMDDVEIIMFSAGDSTAPYDKLIAKNDDDKKFIAEQFKTAPQNHQNILILKSANFVAMVDTGFENMFENIKKELSEINLKPEDITHLIITHAHLDHIGGAVNNGKINYPNAQLYIDQNDFKAWQNDQVAGPVFKAYKDKIVFFKHDQNLLPAQLKIKAIPAYGHTAGHNMISFSDKENKKLVFWADLMHVYAVQNARPEIAIVFDSNPDEAVQTRLKFLKEFKENKTEILGAHLPFGKPIILE